MKTNIMLLIVLVILQVAFGLPDFLPWWAFTVPVFILGVGSFFMELEVPFFTLGFISGFLVWGGTNVFTDMLSENQILDKIGIVFSLNKIEVLIVSGVLGGLLAGLAFYAGSQVISEKEKP